MARPVRGLTLLVRLLKCRTQRLWREVRVPLWAQNALRFYSLFQLKRRGRFDLWRTRSGSICRVGEWSLPKTSWIRRKKPICAHWSLLAEEVKKIVGQSKTCQAALNLPSYFHVVFFLFCAHAHLVRRFCPLMTKTARCCVPLSCTVLLRQMAFDGTTNHMLTCTAPPNTTSTLIKSHNAHSFWLPTLSLGNHILAMLSIVGQFVLFAKLRSWHGANRGCSAFWIGTI